MDTEAIYIKSFLSEKSLAQKITDIEGDIRDQPNRFLFRWQLLLLLCLYGRWERALQQLQLCAKLDKQFAQEAQALRWLIKCEHLREEMFTQGQKKPSFWADKEVAWMDQLWTALTLNFANKTEQADEAREAALDQASQVSGLINGEKFQWITDSDSRLGPVFEVYHNQNYWWLDPKEIKQINFYKPQAVIDLIWAKAQFTLKDLSTFMAYVPARYPLDDAQLADDVLLSSHTYWSEFGETLVIGKGQKVWATDTKDYPLLECQEIIFDAE